MDEIMLKAFLAAVTAGALSGFTGVFIYLLNIPFIGVAGAHSAMAGGVWGMIAGLNPKITAFAAAIAASVAAGPVSDRSKSNVNIIMAVVFSVVMALAFLGAAFVKGGDAVLAGFIWGNIFMAGIGEIVFMAVLWAATGLWTALNYRKICAVLVNREIAAASGINEKLYFYTMLALCGLTVTAGLDIMGGLMIFGLIIIPPAAASRLTRDLKMFFVLSSAFGAFSAAAGCAVSFAFDLPVSACVVLSAAVLFLLSFLSAFRVSH